MDYSDNQVESSTFEHTESCKDHREEGISLESVVEDEGFYDVTSMLEVQLKEEEGPFVPSYNSEVLSEGEQKSVHDSLDWHNSQKGQDIDAGSPAKKEIKSTDFNSADDTDLVQKIEKKKFRCWMCNHSSKRSSDLSRHVKEVHLKYRPYKCTECGYQTYRSYTLKVHKLTVHTVNQNHNRHFEYQWTSGLKSPEEMNYQEETKQSCTHSNCISNFQDHVRNAHMREKIFICPFCDHRTRWEGSLRTHILAVHMKKKPHECPMCDYKSSARYSIMRHFRTVHIKDKPHICPQCPYKTARSDTLKIHLKRVHSENDIMVGKSL